MEDALRAQGKPEIFNSDQSLRFTRPSVRVNPLVTSKLHQHRGSTDPLRMKVNVQLKFDVFLSCLRRSL